MNLQPLPGFIIEIFVISLFSPRLNCCCHLGVSVFPSAAPNFLSFPGSCFVRTDQLDGETDWKLRLPVACTQRLPTAAVSRMFNNTLLHLWACVERHVQCSGWEKHHYCIRLEEWQIATDNNMAKRKHSFLVIYFPTSGFSDKTIFCSAMIILTSDLVKACCYTTLR